jgi:hypothetical protein
MPNPTLVIGGIMKGREMKRLIVSMVAASLLLLPMAQPAKAVVCAPWMWWCYVPPPPPAEPPAVVHHPHNNGTNYGPWVVGCVGLSAFALIASAAHIGRTQNRELTNEEAAQIAFTCGLGALYVNAKS